jgi:hypothetical protein
MWHGSGGSYKDKCFYCEVRCLTDHFLLWVSRLDNPNRYLRAHLWRPIPLYRDRMKIPGRVRLPHAKLNRLDGNQTCWWRPGWGKNILPRWEHTESILFLPWLTKTKNSCFFCLYEWSTLQTLHLALKCVLSLGRATKSFIHSFFIHVLFRASPHFSPWQVSSMDSTHTYWCPHPYIGKVLTKRSTGLQRKCQSLW